MDILSFLKEDKEAKAKEQEEEKEARVIERAEDMRKIEEIILNGVKEEVKAILKPYEDRLTAQEKAVENITMQLFSITKELEVLKASTSPIEKHHQHLRQGQVAQIKEVLSEETGGAAGGA